MSRSLAYFTDLALRRHEGSVITREGDLTVIRSPQNQGFWWGNFLLMPAAPQAGDLARWDALFARHHPGAKHRVFGVDTSGGEASDPAEFLAAGYQVLRDSVLTSERTWPPRRLSRDATFRPLASDADWAAALTLREAVNAADPGGHEPEGYRTFSLLKLASYRRAQEAGHGAMLGAFDATGAMLSGLGIFDAGEGVARYQSVETHPEARSRGLAGTLVHTAGDWAREHLGTRTLVIVADPEYHAQRLYESVGFAKTETQVGFQKRPAAD
ncbi:GNAT family N-acetyltransferase [Deinococcus koreensis]|uniref:GNAT family N-acetyltransferase n=1 Tax=Deinococcus koreensis TaxID=2054903 RepID=A0A2K3UUY0_9DEIO|nr:GNAT family N-acetyltransferase [Deinococcus koreensis]PNY80330.1 GNAT family N-acetyltransferase [Deinococcus koreensis]